MCSWFWLSVTCYYLFSDHNVEAAKILADFSKIVNTPYFVDKTLFLKDFLNEDRKDPKTKVITAPQGFGKSTILDMVRRFLSIEYNSTGKEVDYKNNPNYNIFCAPSKELNICKNNTKFIERHFGKYPLVYLDFAPLKFVKDYRTLLDIMRDIQSVTYEQHSYLLDEGIDWQPGLLKKEGLSRRMDPYEPLRDNEILKGLLVLTGYLHKHFRKKVIILLDNYDSHWGSLLFQKIEKRNHILLTLKKVNEQLFKFEGHMQKGILTGVFGIKDIGILATARKLQFYSFRGNHVFSKYYGFSKEDIKHIVRNVIKCPKTGEKVSDLLKQYYNGYSVEGQEDLALYNSLSVRMFFNNHMKPQNYWVKTKFMDNILNICKINNISDVMEHLLKCGCVKADTNITFTEMDIKKINRVNKKSLVWDSYQIELVIRFFFQLGFLAKENRYNNCLKIANKQAQMIFGGLLTLTYITRFEFHRTDIEFFQKCVNEFTPESKPKTLFIKFRTAVYNLFHDSTYRPKTKNDLEIKLLAFLAETFSTNSCSNSTLEYSTCFESNKEVSDIIVVNDHNMAVIIKVKFQERKSLQKFRSEQLAIAAHNGILDTYNTFVNDTPSQLQTEDVIGAIYIGIGFDQIDRDIKIAGSTFLFENRKNLGYKATYIY